MKEKDILLLKHFRANSRESLTRISRKTKVPISTIYDKLKGYERELILKHTSLVNFSMLGFDIRLRLLVAVTQKDALKNFLKYHDRVNTVYRVNNGYDFEIEALFKNMPEMKEFVDSLDQFGITNKQEHFILEDVVREGFLT